MPVMSNKSVYRTIFRTSTQPLAVLIISSEKKKKSYLFNIYATTAASRPAKTPMAIPLTLFLSAALDSLWVGLGVLDEDSLDDVDSTVLVLKNNINMRSRDKL